MPHTPGGPPLWAAGSVPASLKRCGRYYDGYFPSGPSDAAVFAERFTAVKVHATEAGRPDDAITGAAYLTLAIDDDAMKADARLNAYLESYYNQPAEKLRRYQGCFTGTKAAAIEWLQGFAEVGATHFCVRIVGNHEANIEIAAEMREALQ